MVSKCLLQSKVYESVVFFYFISTKSCTTPVKQNHFIVKKMIMFFPLRNCAVFVHTSIFFTWSMIFHMIPRLCWLHGQHWGGSVTFLPWKTSLRREVGRSCFTQLRIGSFALNDCSSLKARARNSIQRLSDSPESRFSNESYSSSVLHPGTKESQICSTIPLSYHVFTVHSVQYRTVLYSNISVILPKRHIQPWLITV